MRSQRGEVGAGLQRCSRSAPSASAASDVAARQRRSSRTAAAIAARPEQRRGDREPHRQQRSDRRALVVGELAEDRHRAEGGAGGEAEERFRAQA